MAARDSAAFEAERHRLTAVEAQRVVDLAQEAHRRYSAGAHGERRLAKTLEVLESRGYSILADRRWPNSRTARVDSTSRRQLDLKLLTAVISLSSPRIVGRAAYRLHLAVA
jgi:hypothetical protein